MPARLSPRIVGRYALYGEIASGGMATVHFGILRGEAGFSRTVAVKSLHTQFARDPGFVAMFLDEARLTSRIRHPNVVPVLDVVSANDALLIVMEYVQGDSFSRLQRAASLHGERVPLPVLLAISAEVLFGLHAAHEALSEQGTPLQVVHRDVSPQNIMVGSDGVARVLDFGIAKAAARSQTTQGGQLKGKLAYMAPEQLLQKPVDRRVDIFAASVVMWEGLTGRRLFTASDHASIVEQVLSTTIASPKSFAPDIPDALDALVMRGLSRAPEDRFQTADQMAKAVEAIGHLARHSEVGAWVERIASDTLAGRRSRIEEIESDGPRVSAPPAVPPSPIDEGGGEPTLQLREAEPLVSTDVSSFAEISAGEVTPSTAIPARRWKLRVAAVLAAVFFVVFAWVLVPRADGGAKPVASPSLAARDSPLPPTAPESSSSTVAEPSPPSTAAVEPSASVPTHATAAAHVASPPWRPPPWRPPSKVSSKCSPPYVIRDGIKEFKPECM